MPVLYRGGRPQAAAVFVSAALLATLHSQPGGPVGTGGLREPAWSPDGKRLAIVYLDRLWTVTPDGRDARELTGGGSVEREPAWSRDGRQIAYAADAGGGFDIFVTPMRGGAARRLTSLAGDERSPSWTPDGRLVFAHRATASVQWDLYIIATGQETAAPQRLTDSPHQELQPRVSPDGRRVAFTSNRESEDGDFDIWIMRLPGPQAPAGAPSEGPTRLGRARGDDGYPCWSPDGERLAFYAVRDGVASTWVAPVDPLPAADGNGARVRRPRPVPPPVLVSRHGGSLAWSPDGRTLTIGEIPDPEPGYNGNPHRDAGEPPPLFAVAGYRLWHVPAPRPIDEDTRALAPALDSSPRALLQAFDRVWATLSRMYYSGGTAATTWEVLRGQYRPQAQAARDAAALEDVVDAMLLEAPLIKPVVVSSQAVVVSAHPLASEAGRLVLQQGGNVVDAAIAVAFVLGVVEPEASGIGGDGQAVLYMRSMREPTVVEYKDQTPMKATLDNPRIFRDGRLVTHGPAAVNIPGVVAGLEHLYKHYGSGRLKWEHLVAPAIGYAEEGFVLDEALPSSLAEGRQLLEKYPESARIYLPEGRLPRPGDRFVNTDYAETLRGIARGGAEAFYRGDMARRIAADMEANGGLLTYDDLAQYRAIERAPVSGRYRGHVLYTGGPPVGSGVGLLEAFQILGHYSPRANAMPATDADYWHYMIESWKARDSIRRIADPAHWPVEYESHLQLSHAAELFRKIEVRRVGAYPEDDQDAAPGGERIGRGTTAFVVADADGNMISVTHTLSTWGGAFYVSKGLGFLYNNHLRSNRATPGAYGRLLPLMRSNTASVPTLVFREEAGERISRLALGVAGNAWISASAYSTIAAVLDGGLSMQRALEAPRFLVGRDPSDPYGMAARVEIEDRFPRAVLRDLSARGHRFHKIGRKGEVRYGYASAALVDVANRRVEGGSEPRRSHLAVALDRTLSR